MEWSGCKVLHRKQQNVAKRQNVESLWKFAACIGKGKEHRNVNTFRKCTQALSAEPHRPLMSTLNQQVHVLTHVDNSSKKQKHKNIVGGDCTCFLYL